MLPNSGLFGSSIGRADAPTLEQLLNRDAKGHGDSVLEKATAAYAQEAKRRVFVLYHADSDGRVAGWCAWKFFQGLSAFDKRFFEVQYKEPFPIAIEDLRETDEVYILDFSYDRQTLDDVYQRVSKLVVLDHHKTAEAELRGLPYAVFDETKAGSLLAWEYFFPCGKPPMIVTLTNDRDLWKFEHPDSRFFEDAIRHENLRGDFYMWDRLATDGTVLQAWIDKGKLLRDIVVRQVKSITRRPGGVVLVSHNGRRVGMCNANMHVSEVSEDIYLDPKWAVDYSLVFQFSETGSVLFSLRSKKVTGDDVSAVASCYGGGGHHNAAGFKLGNEEGIALLSRLYANRIV